MANSAYVVLNDATVIAEPQTGQVQNTTVLSFPVSVRTNKKNEKTGYYITDLYNISVWGTRAENLVKNLKKGDKTFIIGTVRMGDPYTDREGKTHIRPQVTVTDIQINLPPKPKNTAESDDAPF